MSFQVAPCGGLWQGVAMTEEQMWRIAAVGAASAFIPLLISLGDKALQRWRKRNAARDSKPLNTGRQ